MLTFRADFDSLVWKDYQPYMRMENPSLSYFVLENEQLNILTFDLRLLGTCLLVVSRLIPVVATPHSRFSL